MFRLNIKVLIAPMNYQINLGIQFKTKFGLFVYLSKGKILPLLFRKSTAKGEVYLVAN